MVIYSQTPIELAEEFLSYAIGDYDPNVPHMERTASRFLSALNEITSPEDVNLTVFPNKPKVNEMVVISPIKFYSLCAHHVLPFFGEAHVAYVPESKLLGLSKIPRVVRETSKGLHVQETLTWTISEMISEALQDPVGVAVVMKAQHLCMSMRGVRETEAYTTTSAMLGCFLDPTKHAREEFLALANGN